MSPLAGRRIGARVAPVNALQTGTRRHFDADYREDVVLRDGSAVFLRLVRPSDKALLVRGLERLSKESRYMRFFTNKSRWSDAELAYLTELDQERHLAIGAGRLDADGNEEGIGVARFVVSPDDPALAEAAVALLDEVQNVGLGRLLFMRLIAAARERGVERFFAETLPDNFAMQRLWRSFDPESTESRGASRFLSLRLPDVSPTAAMRGPVETTRVRAKTAVETP